MAAEHDPKELIKKYVADLHSLVEHGHKAVSRQVDQLKDSEFPEAHRAVVDFEKMLDQHNGQLEQHLKSLGGNVSSPVQDAASAVAGAAAGVYNAVRSEEASKSIRDDYTFLSLTSISSLMLYTTAKSIDDEQTATIAERVYRDAARCIERIDDMMPRLIVGELNKDGFRARDVSNTAHQLVGSSWGTSSSLRGQQTTGATASSA
ncbi:MAG TPA: hypothetical protein VHX16_13850 [Chloroflexota bacterium]|jgi:hypothetical protein|nr:hypothetical protein [Chloroflexota bacterium]